MKADDCRPAVLDDALAMGIQFPNRQRQNPIVFLGTIWSGAGGGRLVPVLGVWIGLRELHLRWFGGVWNCRFAAVRESR